MTKEEIIEYLISESKTFHLNEYLKEPNNQQGVTILITPQQLIITRNIVFKEDIGKNYGLHDKTRAYIDNLLYNTPIDYLETETYQNIFIKIINQTHTCIYISFPPTITSSQLELLKQLSNEYTKQPEVIIGFCSNNQQEIIDNDFTKAITYAEIKLINDNQVKIKDNIIIGRTLDPKELSETGDYHI